MGAGQPSGAFPGANVHPHVTTPVSTATRRRMATRFFPFQFHVLLLFSPAAVKRAACQRANAGPTPPGRNSIIFFISPSSSSSSYLLLLLRSAPAMRVGDKVQEQAPAPPPGRQRHGAPPPPAAAAAACSARNGRSEGPKRWSVLQAFSVLPKSKNEGGRAKT